MSLANLTCKEIGTTPTDPNEWDSLCLARGNLLQSTLYDPVQNYFGLVPFYLEARQGAELMGGVKVYLNRSRRIPWLYSSSLIFGEVLLESVLEEQVLSRVLAGLSSQLEYWADRNGIASMVQSAFYGGPSLNLGVDTRVSEWGIASVDLTVSEDELLKRMHSKHRNMVNRAIREELVFEERDSIEDFLLLLKETYREQGNKCPDLDYIAHHYRTLAHAGVARLYFVASKDSTPLASAFVQTYGTVADYTFAGGVKNNVGAGQFLQYKIFLEQKSKGCSKYILGQVAEQEDDDNLKFSCGITRFKTRFGVDVVSGRKLTRVRRPWNERIWRTINDLRRRR